jgi:predicted nucleotide-binding protein
MATKTKQISPQSANLTVQQMKIAIPTLERRINELTAIDYTAITGRNDPFFESLVHKIDDTLISIFGAGTIEYNRYCIHSLDTARISFYNEASLNEIINGYRAGALNAIQTLQTIIQIFSEKISDSTLFNSNSEKLSDLKSLAESHSISEISGLSGIQKSQVIDFTKVFIVHGRDEFSKISTARYIEKLGLNAIILHEQASSGNTIIEKIEANTNVGFAIVIYTPCDTGGLANQTESKFRARQNVVFEHGYLIAKLGRKNVCALVKGDIEIPNDISGVVYVSMDEHNAWQISIAKELRAAGFSIDMNKVI